MSCAYETFLVARPIIAILGPNWVDVIPVFPRSFESSRSDDEVGILVLTDIVVRVSPRALRSITDLLLPKISPCAKARNPAKKKPTKGDSRRPKPNKRLLSLIMILTSTRRLGSRPLTESTKQITPPTKSGHAPPLRESRKNNQSVNPYPFRIW